jgi:hypothetical protein
MMRKRRKGLGTLTPAETQGLGEYGVLLLMPYTVHQQQQQPARSTPGSASGWAVEKSCKDAGSPCRYVARGTINAYRGWAAKYTPKS